jgi:CO dehydrogenase maturation factor
MKLAVVGKGGSGKTTTAALIARTLARTGAPVVALDCDTNPNLGISLGLGEEETERLIAMRQALDEGTQEHAPGWDELIGVFGTDAPDGVRLAVVSAIQNPQPGCPCCGLSPDQLLCTADFGEVTVVADLEAGIGTLGRLEASTVDIVLLMVEASAKSIEVGTRAAELVRENSLGTLVVIANKLRHEADLDAVRRAFPTGAVVPVPHDDLIVEADRRGLSPLDLAPDAPAVRAIAELADTLVQQPAERRYEGTAAVPSSATSNFSSAVRASAPISAPRPVPVRSASSTPSS